MELKIRISETFKLKLFLFAELTEILTFPTLFNHEFIAC